MSQWKQIGLVALLAIVAAVLLLYRLPGVTEGFSSAFNASYKREFNRAYQTAANQAGQGRMPMGQMAAQHAPSITPDTVTQLRDQIRRQRMHPTSADTIGEQLDMNFRDHTWHLGTLPNGTQVLRFEGLIAPDAAAELRRSLRDALGRMRSTTPRAALDDAIDELQPGMLFQLGFAILPNGQPGKLERLGVENTTLGNAGLPLDAWLERILQ